MNEVIDDVWTVPNNDACQIPKNAALLIPVYRRGVE